MKQLLSILACLMVAVAAFAQQPVTKYRLTIEKSDGRSIETFPESVYSSALVDVTNLTAVTALLSAASSQSFSNTTDAVTILSTVATGTYPSTNALVRVLNSMNGQTVSDTNALVTAVDAILPRTYPSTNGLYRTLQFLDGYTILDAAALTNGIAALGTNVLIKL